MRCPKCEAEAQMKSPDYGNGVEYQCNNHGEYRFDSSSPEAASESSASRSLSRAHAEALPAITQDEP